MNTEPSEEKDSRFEHLMDGAGFTAEHARQIVEGRVTNLEIASTALASVKGIRHQPRHYSRRGGRAFPEPSDSELDIEWKVTEPSMLSDEQLQVNATGIGLVRAVAEFVEQPDIKGLPKDVRQQKVNDFIKAYINGTNKQ